MTTVCASGSGSGSDENPNSQTNSSLQQEESEAAGRTSPSKFQGVPVGVVRIKARHVQPFRNLLDRQKFKSKVRFREVERATAENKNLITLHLSSEIAGALDDGRPDLLQFLQEHAAEYLPGVRRKRRSTMAADASVQDHNNRNHDNGAVFTFVELFAGIGGFRLGLEALGGRCVLACEKNNHATTIYRENFDDPDGVLLEGDVIDLDLKTDFAPQAANFTMLTAGFPCQPFTNRGLQQGLSDERGQLYRELVRILHGTQPPCFLFENVVGLVTMDGGTRGKRMREGVETKISPGKVFQRIMNSFASCGYEVDWHVINSRHCLPQQRERVYMVGIRTDLTYGRTIQWDTLFNTSSGSQNKRLTVRNILEPITEHNNATELNPSQWNKVKKLHCEKDNKHGHKYQAQTSETTTTDTITTAYLVNTIKNSASINIDSKAPTLISQYHRVGSFSTRFVFQEADGTARDGVRGNRRPRFLTPRECCRIMGFPQQFVVPTTLFSDHDHPDDAAAGPVTSDDDDEEEDYLSLSERKEDAARRKKISENERAMVSHFYQAIGNAVTPPVVTAIAKQLFQCMSSMATTDDIMMTT